MRLFHFLFGRWWGAPPVSKEVADVFAIPAVYDPTLAIQAVYDPTFGIVGTTTTRLHQRRNWDEIGGNFDDIPGNFDTVGG